MAGQDSSLEVRICARGLLSDEILAELSGLSPMGDLNHLVLQGVVVDRAALIGVLERLRRAGIHIEDVEVVPPLEESPRPSLPIVARLEFHGKVADLLAMVVTEPHVIGEAARTTMEVALQDDSEALFDLLARLERIALNVHELHVRTRHG